jgi:hypothetical protein
LYDTAERATVRQVGGHWVAHVSWRNAAALQAHLRRGGLYSVPALGAAKREAWLELESNPDEARVRAAVAAWRGRDGRPRGIRAGPSPPVSPEPSDAKPGERS